MSTLSWRSGRKVANDCPIPPEPTAPQNAPLRSPSPPSSGLQNPISSHQKTHPYPGPIDKQDHTILRPDSVDLAKAPDAQIRGRNKTAFSPEHPSFEQGSFRRRQAVGGQVDTANPPGI